KGLNSASSSSVNRWPGTFQTRPQSIQTGYWRTTPKALLVSDHFKPFTIGDYKKRCSDRERGVIAPTFAREIRTLAFTPGCAPYSRRRTAMSHSRKPGSFSKSWQSDTATIGALARRLGWRQRRC